MKKKLIFLVSTTVLLVLHSLYILNFSNTILSQSPAFDERIEVYDALDQKLEDPSWIPGKDSVKKIHDAAKKMDFASEDVDILHFQQACIRVLLLLLHITSLIIMFKKSPNNRIEFDGENATRSPAPHS